MRTTRSALSRRSFLSTAAGSSGAILLGSTWMNAAAQDVDPRVAQVIAATISIDMHNHVYPEGTDPNPLNGKPPQGPEPALADALKTSGLTAVCASYVLDVVAYKTPGDALNTYLQWLTAIDLELARGHMHRALTLKDLQAAHRSHKPTIVQTVEGALFLEGHLDRVEEVYRRGVRNLQLLHERDDLVAPLGDTNTGTSNLGGLTAFGAQVVKECNRLGIVVDLAHASHETVLGALKVSSQPPIISHTSLDSRTGGDPVMLERMKPRLISKEHAKVVADAGGIVGVWTKMADSLQDFVSSIKVMADAIGIDHTGIGTDSDVLSTRPGQGTSLTYPGMPADFFKAVVGEMLRQGFAPADITKVTGGNYCRVFDKVTSRHA